MSTLCPKCGMKPVPGCEGRGHIPVPGSDGMVMKMCRNMYAKAMREHLGREISQVKHVSTSPLAERTGDNLFLVGTDWWGLLPHLKLTLAAKGLSFSFGIVTDQQIKNVFVGNEQYRARPRDRRESAEVFNSLGDLVGDRDLVIIKLGYIGHRNKAAPGALREALLIRENMGVPTWVFLDSHRAWTHSHDEEVEYYLESKFETVEIEPADPQVDFGPRFRLDGEGDDIGSDEPEEEVMRVIEEPSCEYDSRNDEEYEDTPSLAASGISLPGESKSKRRWR